VAVGPAAARLARGITCVGRLDMRAHAKVLSALRTDTPA
jgi:hypothetical protein